MYTHMYTCMVPLALGVLGAAVGRGALAQSDLLRSADRLTPAKHPHSWLLFCMLSSPGDYTRRD